MDELQQISKYTPQSNYFGSDYCFATFSSAEMLSQISGSVKLEGLAIMLCTQGCFSIAMNFEQVSLEAGDLAVFSPGDYLELSDAANSRFECHVIYLSREFLANFNMDPNAIDYRNIMARPHAAIRLHSTQQEIINRQFDLLNFCTAHNTSLNVYTRNVGKALISAIIYQLLSFLSKQNNLPDDNIPSRRNAYVHDFLLLVKENFAREHAVNFYADRLFISPKYLSMLVKEATGATATEWIDRHIVLEAKNLLRFSSKNIQQIAYTLNFANQSSFGKYFKHHTNLSPSQYRKT